MCAFLVPLSPFTVGGNKTLKWASLSALDSGSQRLYTTFKLPPTVDMGGNLGNPVT